jgi:hypothetical protein
MRPLCPEPESNRHGPIKVRRILSPLRLPISPPGRARGCGWRPGSESNRRTRLCRPLHDHSATWPSVEKSAQAYLRATQKTKPRFARGFIARSGAGNETRTRDPDLGKVVLYQLSYSRARPAIIRIVRRMSTSEMHDGAGAGAFSARRASAARPCGCRPGPTRS